MQTKKYRENLVAVCHPSGSCYPPIPASEVQAPGQSRSFGMMDAAVRRGGMAFCNTASSGYAAQKHQKVDHQYVNRILIT